MARKEPTLREIAQRIDAHLDRFEADPKINKVVHGMRSYYYAGARVAGRWVSVAYISFQGPSSLDRERALRYLAWLDAGNIGRHYEAERE
jgi:hypothetical protein